VQIEEIRRETVAADATKSSSLAELGTTHVLPPMINVSKCWLPNASVYLAGKLDQWFVKQDRTGVVFILNVTDRDEAKAMLEQLPLGRAGLMTFQLIPLGPLSPLGLLLTKPNH
jgi:hypothetical protein